jgi:hypothetical protein
LDCTSSSDCPEGGVCVRDSCCIRNVCVPPEIWCVNISETKPGGFQATDVGPTIGGE